jgi:formate hydrogenlyase subunit 4
LRKQQIRPAGTTVLFVVAPAVVAGSALLVAAALPLVTTASPLDPAADLFAVVGVLLIGTVALALAGLDTGTAFGGMGASRGMTVAALVEPTLLMAMFALSVPAGSTNLGAIVSAGAADPWRAISPSAVLALAALMVAVLAEAGRLPVDNPATHLELTMIHEAMVLEYAGPRLAIMEWAGGMRLTVLLALLANLLLPFGVAGAAAGIGAVLLAAGLIAVKVTVLAAALAAVEVFVAKLRLFRVPELLAGSFVLALLAVTAAFFLTGSGV